MGDGLLHLQGDLNTPARAIPVWKGQLAQEHRQLRWAGQPAEAGAGGPAGVVGRPREEKAAGHLRHERRRGFTGRRR
jgi:hypothetical protein